MAEGTAFSTSGENAITRTIDVQAEETVDFRKSPNQFQEFYEIDRTVAEIISGDYKQVRQPTPHRPAYLNPFR